MSTRQRNKIDYTTHEGIMSGFVDAVHEVIAEVEKKQKHLDDCPGNNDETARAWNTRQIIKRWFHNNGGI